MVWTIVRDQGDRIVISETMAIMAPHDCGDLGREHDWTGAIVMRAVADSVGSDQDLEEGD